MDIGILIPATLTQVIAEFVKVVDICILIPATITQVTVEVLEVMEIIGIKIQATLPQLIV